MRLALALTLGTVLLLPAGAAARSPFRSLGQGYADSDGERYAWILPAAGGDTTTPGRVFDDATGRSWELKQPREGCRISGVAAGSALWICWTGAPLVQDLDSGAPREVPGWDTYQRWLNRYLYYGFGPADVSGFGSRWLEGVTWCYHCGPSYSYMDWHSGTFVSSTTDLAERIADLDSPQLDVPLCDPLTRLAPREPEGAPKFIPATYERPWLLRNLSNSSPRVRLYRCGRVASILVARCHLGDCLSRQLGGGWLTWRDGYRVYGFDLRSRQRRLIAVAPSSISAPGIVHTARRVYASGGGKVYAARLPRR